MAAPLRYALGLLVCCAIGSIYAPLIPAANLLFSALRHPDAWLSLSRDVQFLQALAATLTSTLAGVGGALVITLCAIATLWPSRRWRRLVSALPVMLAVPHIAFASGVLLLAGDGGWLYRLLPWLPPVSDRYGIGLGLTIAIKESAFLLWIAYAILNEGRLAEKVITLQSLGYGRGQCFRALVLRVVVPSLTLALTATLAWTLSTVDVALVIGPGNPPTLAVLAWQWLSQGDSIEQQKGALASLLLTALTACLMALGWLIWHRLRHRVFTPDGERRPTHYAVTGSLLAWSIPSAGILCVALLAAIASEAVPSMPTVIISLGLALGGSFFGAVICLLWLEWGLSRVTWLLYLPLVLPALPLAAGQYQLALIIQQDGTLLSVLWGHLLWIIPWMLFILSPAWQAIDPRAITLARTLGWSRSAIFRRVKCPQLIRPILAALGVGFSVSIAQYLPTLWLGAGRVATLTSEAVALSSSGIPRLLAAQALWQLLLPGAFFFLIALLMRITGRWRQGLR